MQAQCGVSLGTLITIPLTPRNVGAALGIVAAVVTIAFIMFRLAQANAPVPTGLVLQSEATEPISVLGLRVDGEEVLPAGWTPSSAASTDASAAAAIAAASVLNTQATVALRVGRPSQIEATLSLPRAATASCSLDPRPHGRCLIKVRFVSAAELRCVFECKAEASSP